MISAPPSTVSNTHHLRLNAHDSLKQLLSSAGTRKRLAILDQAIVSGTNFLSIVLIGRMCGATELGVYSLAFSVLVMITCVQTSITTGPYLHYRTITRLSVRQQYAGSTFLQVMLLASFSVIVLLLLVGALEAWPITQLDGTVFLVLAVTIPFVLLRDFVRGFAFAHSYVGTAILLDVTVAMMQLCGLLLLASASELSAATAYIALGVAVGTVGCSGLFLMRGQLDFRWTEHVSAFRRNWSFGRSELANRVALVARVFLIPWLLAFQCGVATSGVFVTCLTILAYSSPLMKGLRNVFERQVVRVFFEGGMADVRRFAMEATLVFGALASLCCLAALTFGTSVLEWMFGGQNSEHWWLLVILALSAFVNVLDHGVLSTMRVLPQNNLNSSGSVVGLISSAVTAIILMPSLGIFLNASEFACRCFERGSDNAG